jgi:hypothetical protein
MGRGIVRLADDEYVVWSTVVDAPVSFVLSAEEARLELAEMGYHYPEDVIERADRRMTSFVAPPYTLDDLIGSNRAGPGETRITLHDIRRLYQRPNRPSLTGPTEGVDRG